MFPVTPLVLPLHPPEQIRSEELAVRKLDLVRGDVVHVDRGETMR